MWDNIVRHIFKSYLGDVIETTHERIQRVEEAQNVVHVLDQPQVTVHHQVFQRGRDHRHLEQSKEESNESNESLTKYIMTHELNNCF